MSKRYARRRERRFFGGSRRRSLNTRLRMVMAWAIPIFFIFWFPLMFYENVLGYRPHNQDISAYIIALPCVVGCSVFMCLAAKYKEPWLAAVYGLAVVSCIFFCYWISRIPFCTVWEPISPEDLGFMLRPFADRFFVQ